METSWGNLSTWESSLLSVKIRHLYMCYSGTTQSKIYTRVTLLINFAVTQEVFAVDATWSINVNVTDNLFLSGRTNASLISIDTLGSMYDPCFSRSDTFRGTSSRNLPRITTSFFAHQHSISPLTETNSTSALEAWNQGVLSSPSKGFPQWKRRYLLLIRSTMGVTLKNLVLYILDPPP